MNAKSLFEEIVKIGVNEVIEMGKKRKEELADAEIIKIDEKKGRAFIRTKNGTALTKYPIEAVTKETQYGYAVKCSEEFNEENLKKAKEVVLEKMFDIIRDIAEAIPEEIFVIKTKDTVREEYMNSPMPESMWKAEVDAMDYFTVGCNIVLPNAYKG